MITINEDKKLVLRKCQLCPFEEEIEFYWLSFDGEDSDNFNCHHVYQCPECRNYYDIVLEPDELNYSYGHGEQIIVEIINYREHEDLFYKYKNKVN